MGVCLRWREFPIPQLVVVLETIKWPCYTKSSCIENLILGAVGTAKKWPGTGTQPLWRPKNLAHSKKEYQDHRKFLKTMSSFCLIIDINGVPWSNQRRKEKEKNHINDWCDGN